MPNREGVGVANVLLAPGSSSGSGSGASVAVCW
jgi:hypothetical protein